MTWLAHRPRALGRLRGGGLPTRVAAFAGIAAILLQGAFAVAHAVTLAAVAARASAGGPAILDGGPLVLCRYDGALGDHAAAPGARPRHALPACPLCQAVQHLGAWLPPAPATPAFAPRGTPVVAPRALPLPPPLAASLDVRARAPPARA